MKVESACVVQVRPGEQRVVNEVGHRHDGKIVWRRLAEMLTQVRRAPDVVTPKRVFRPGKGESTVFHDQLDAGRARAQVDRLLDYVNRTVPAALAHLDPAPADILA